MNKTNKCMFICEIAQTGNTIIQINKYDSGWNIYELGEAYEEYGQRIKTHWLYSTGNRCNIFIGLSIEQLTRAYVNYCEYYIVKEKY